MNITKVTAKQFEKIVERQGKTVIDFITGAEYKVLFSKAGATNMQDKIKISYAESCPLAKGSIVEFKNNYYILVNQDNIESDVYCTSVAIKCNDVWDINGDKIPVVCGNLSSFNPKAGTVYTNGKSTVGNITIYTSSDTRATEIVPGDINYCCDDFYHIVNKFSIDGLTYLYMQRETLNGKDELQYVDGMYFLEVGTELQLHIARVMRDENNKVIGRYLQKSEFTYTSSNEDVATVTEDGLLTVHAIGSTTITVATDGLTLKINLAAVTFPYVQLKCNVYKKYDDGTSTTVYNTGKILLPMVGDEDRVTFYSSYFTSMTETEEKQIRRWEIYDSRGNRKGWVGKSDSGNTLYNNSFDLVYDDSYVYDRHKLTISTTASFNQLSLMSYITSENIYVQEARDYYEGQIFTVKIIYEDGTTGEASYEFSQFMKEIQDAVINNTLY